MLEQHGVDQGKHQGAVGFRLDGHPFRRGGAGHRQMGLDTDPFDAARAGFGMAPDGADAAGHFHIRAKGKNVTAMHRIGADGKGAMPELAIKVLGMGAFDALAGAETEIGGSPGGQEGWQRAHIGGRGAAMAEAGGQAGQAMVVAQATGLDFGQPAADFVQRLVPADGNETRILVAPLAGIGPPHGGEDAMGIVGFLNQAISLDANPAVGGVDAGCGKVRPHFRGDAVFHLDRQQVRSRDAVIAIGWDATRGCCLCRFHPGGLSSFRFSRNVHYCENMIQENILEGKICCIFVARENAPGVKIMYLQYVAVMPGWFIVISFIRSKASSVTKMSFQNFWHCRRCRISI